MKHLRTLSKVALLLCLLPAYATFNNRFFPPSMWLSYPLIPYCTTNSFLVVQPFFSSASQAFRGCERVVGEDDNCGLPLFEMEGRLRLADLDRSLQAAGITSSSLIKSEWRAAGAKLPYALGGRVEGGGVALHFSVPLSCCWSVGAQSSVYHFRSMLETKPLPDPKISPWNESDITEIRELYNEMTRKLGLDTCCWSRTSMGDIEFYLRYATYADYCARMRRIRASIQGGVIAPVSTLQNINWPASIPADNNGHWGIYARGSVDLLLKEDVSLGFNLRLQKNFARTRCYRMPIGDEPYRYGALVGEMTIDPGMTVGFSPYILVEGLRAGLGANVAYSMVYHRQDKWCAAPRSDGLTPCLSKSVKRTSWGAEHINVAVFYDFARDSQRHCVRPLAGVSVHMPVEWLASERAARSTGITLFVAFDF